MILDLVHKCIVESSPKYQYHFLAILNSYNALLYIYENQFEITKQVNQFQTAPYQFRYIFQKRNLSYFVGQFIFMHTHMILDLVAISNSASQTKQI
jgi:hypothetical protein